MGTGGRLGVVLAAVSLAMFCVQVDYFALNLALPTIARDLGSSATDLQWVVSAYMLALGAFMIPAGRLGDIFGRRRALLGGVALFGLASALCATATSMGLLIGWRALQGLGAAFILPVAVGVLRNAFPAERTARAIGLAYGLAGVGNALGPFVGGLLTQEAGWRWVFWVNVPLAAAAIALGVRSIPESRDETVPRRLDVAGLALVCLAIGAFTLAVDRAPTLGWASAATVAVLAGAAAALAAFVAVERRVRWPLVDLSLARNLPYVVLACAGTVSNIAYGVTIFGSTLYLQEVRSLDPLVAGLVFLGPSSAAALGGPLAGWAATRQPAIRVMGLSCAAGALALAALGAVSAWGAYVPALAACGLAMGLVFAFTTIATQAVVRPERAGEASGIVLTMQVALAGMGVAVAGTAIETLRDGGASAAGSIQTVFLVLAAALLPAGLVVLAMDRAIAWHGQA